MPPWYAERIPVGFAVHGISILLIEYIPLPFYLSIVTLVWHEVGNLVTHHQRKTSISKHAGLSMAAAACLLSTLDSYIVIKHPDMLWHHAGVRGVTVFVGSLLLGTPWKDIFSIGYLLLACTASTQLFVTGPPADFRAHVAIICASDAFQYFVGKAIGKHKAVPSVSPNKTLEGYMGGIVLTNILSLIFARDPFDYKYLGWYNGILLCGIIGDLAISSWKRYHVMKDTSDLLASHGGLLDRVDSHVGALFFTIVYMYFVQGGNVTISYTGIDTDKLDLCTAAVWALIWIRVLMRLIFMAFRKRETSSTTSNVYKRSLRLRHAKAIH